jgi:hypothetical protein
MVDTGTGLSLLAPSAFLLKILGPTADYLGNEVQQWTARRVENVNRVFEKAGEKIGPEGLETPGSVPPKVLKGVLEEASFCEDELAAEYLGGVLASSRTHEGRDDRAVSLLALVSRLSTYQLRTHYVMYATAQEQLAAEPEVNLAEDSTMRGKATFFLPDSLFDSAMEFSEEEKEPERFQPIIDHTVHGLAREGLINDRIIGTGPASFLRHAFKRDFPEAGIVFCLSMLGMELFVVAHGVPGRPMSSFLKRSADFDIEEPLSFEGSLVRLPDLPPISKSPDPS